jgi:hypothetical protein
MDTVEYPTAPRGVWCYFSGEDFSYIPDNYKRMKKPGKNLTVRRRSDAPIAAISPNDQPVPYLTIGQETRGDITYDVVTVSFYYKDNPATGPGWQLQPTNPKMGYHPDDMEFISIYYLEGSPQKVFMSAHSVGGGNGTWTSYENCEFRDGFLVVYVARNSHANYPTAGTQYRIYGFANDVTERTGPNQAYTWAEMNKSYDWNNGHGITLYKNLRPPPPDTSKTQTQRILYGLV